MQYHQLWKMDSVVLSGQMLLALAAFSSCAIIGLFVWLKDARSPVNRFFGLFNVTLGLWNAGDFVVLYFAAYPQIALIGDRVANVAGVAFIAFSVRFFSALSGDSSTPASVRITTRFFAPVLSILMMSPLIIADVQVKEGAYQEIAGPAFLIFGGYLFWGLAYGIYRIWQLRRHSDERKRIQAQYMLAAFGLGLVGVVAYAGWVLIAVNGAPPFYFIFEIGYSLITAYVILKHGAMDIRTVVHRTVLWLATSTLIVIPTSLLLWWSYPFLGGRSLTLGLLLVSVCLSILVYARRIQPHIDHYFQRRRYDLYSSVQHLAEQLVPLRSIGDVSEKVVSTVRETLYTEEAFVTVLSKGTPRTTYPFRDRGIVFDREVFEYLATHNEILRRSEDMPKREVGYLRRYFDRFNMSVAVPFVKDGVLIGVLHLGPKRNLQRYTELDMEFLNRLRSEVTVAYHNSLLFEDVAALTKELESWNAELEQKIHDRTQELEGAYNQLKELDQSKTRFFATVSHELRTPLTLILAPLESLLKGEMGPISEGVQRHVTVMHQNGLRLLKQINNLLDLTKLDAGRMTLKFCHGDLGAFFRGLVASVAPIADKKGIRLEAREESALPDRVYFDRDRLEKVVLNLLFNAIKFTDSGGRVTLTWGLTIDGQVRVGVADTGIGIGEKDLPKLFKRFSQIDAATNRRYEGTGIGLALAKEIVELHGGQIQVESQLGRGSTFTVTIPLLLEIPYTDQVGSQLSAPEEKAADWTQELRMAAERQTAGIVVESPLAAGPSLSPANGRQILIVEDNADMREFIAFELQGEYRILKAANGIEGMRIASEQLPDMILSDVMMPEMDGYQLCREIRKDPRTMHIPIILLTARADMAMKIEGLEHGADDYLTKPFNAQELRAKIKALLEQRRLEREIQQRNEALEAALEELKATQAQLVQSEKMAGLGMLVAGMAHEINNPINFAKNSLSVLQTAWDELKPLLVRTNPDPEAAEAVEDVDASLGIVKNGVSRTEQIVGQLKAFVRKDQNQKISFSVREGLESTVELVRPTLGKQIVLHADLQSNRPVLAVPGKLNQVWMNLVQNAVQAVGGTGEIWVESRDHEHMVTVTVRDSGSGIKPEHMARLFEPFFTTKPVGQGTGLGLSVSYQIVQEVGGRIDVKSEPGHGAEFTVVLPLAQVLSAAA